MRAADLHRRPLAPARAAGAEREDRRERLDPDDAPPDDALLVVEGVDHRVAAAAARSRARSSREQRRRASAPSPGGSRGARGERGCSPAFVTSVRRALEAARTRPGLRADPALQRSRALTKKSEPTHAGDGAHQRGMQEHAAEVAKIELRNRGGPKAQEAEASAGSERVVDRHRVGSAYTLQRQPRDK